MRQPRQGNNAYVFPGIGLAAVAMQAETLPDTAFLTASRTLADSVSIDDLSQGSLYPPLSQLRELSRKIAINVAIDLSPQRDNTALLHADATQSVDNLIFDPHY